MIVDDFYVVAVAIAPHETGAPRIIDSDRVLPFPVSSKCFQLIPRRRSQNLQFRSRVELEQLPQGHAFDGAKTFAVMILKEFLSVPRAKTLNHTSRISRAALYVKHVTITRVIHRQIRPAPLCRCGGRSKGRTNRLTCDAVL